MKKVDINKRVYKSEQKMLPLLTLWFQNQYLVICISQFRAMIARLVGHHMHKCLVKIYLWYSDVVSHVLLLISLGDAHDYDHPTSRHTPQHFDKSGSFWILLLINFHLFDIPIIQSSSYVPLWKASFVVCSITLVARSCVLIVSFSIISNVWRETNFAIGFSG